MLAQGPLFQLLAGFGVRLLVYLGWKEERAREFFARIAKEDRAPATLPRDEEAAAKAALQARIKEGGNHVQGS